MQALLYFLIFQTPLFFFNNNLCFSKMENIKQFLTACREFGVAPGDCFETIDLYEQKNIGLVLQV